MGETGQVKKKNNTPKHKFLETDVTLMKNLIILSILIEGNYIKDIIGFEKPVLRV